MTFAVTCLELLRRALAGAILDLHLEAAGAADAAHRRRREDGHERLGHVAELLAHASRRSRWRSSPGWPTRFSKGSSGVNITPAAEELERERTFSPATVKAPRTPGVLRATSERRASTFCVRSIDGGIGQLHADDQVALILREE